MREVNPERRAARETNSTVNLFWTRGNTGTQYRSGNRPVMHFGNNFNAIEKRIIDIVTVVRYLPFIRRIRSFLFYHISAYIPHPCCFSLRQATPFSSSKTAEPHIPKEFQRLAVPELGAQVGIGIKRICFCRLDQRCKTAPDRRSFRSVPKQTVLRCCRSRLNSSRGIPVSLRTELGNPEVTAAESGCPLAIFQL